MSNSSPIFQQPEEVLKQDEGWKPFNTSRRSSLLPHPFEVSVVNNNSNSTIFSTDYAFPPRTSPSAAGPWSTTTNNNYFYQDIASVPMLPEVSEEPFYREQRSMSYSFGHDEFYNNKLFSPTNTNNLSTIMQEEEDYEEDGVEDIIFARTRSKSSAAIMDIWSPNAHVQTDIEDAKWLAAQSKNHRRSSLIPPSVDHQHPQQRRFSLAPVTSSLLKNNSISSSSGNTNNNTSLLNQRRHSLAGPTTTTTTTTTNKKTSSSNSSMMMMNSILELESLSIRQRPSLTVEEPTESSFETMMKIDDMGKGTRLDSEILNDATFYVIEFKGGRSDLFYSKEHDSYKKNDLVIVEADRGRDLGKISMEDISREQLERYYTQLKRNANHSNSSNTGDINIEEQQQQKTHYQSNEIYIKCIFRNAKSDEITLLMAKGQDESKALMVCQSKIKQKKLNMQVVDAEYQWDRRKLIFYFIAEKRVDFRELVRELFKLYKTRIWMCAVTSISAFE